MRALKTLRADTTGSVAIEFALIGPALLTMLLGVLQIGVAMQNYNALRSASADAARYAVVNYQADANLTTVQIQSYALNVAANAPYSLKTERLSVTVADATLQRIAGARELTMSMSYRIPTVLTIMGMGDIPISYDRPIFLIENT